LEGANLIGAIMPDGTTEDLSNAQIQLNKTTFALVKRSEFLSSPCLPKRAMVGLVLFRPNNSWQRESQRPYDISYQDLRGRTSGELVFTAPAQTGSYDFRMHENGKEITSTSFIVQ
jgi:hypothetical protein